MPMAALFSSSVAPRQLRTSWLSWASSGRADGLRQASGFVNRKAEESAGCGTDGAWSRRRMLVLAYELQGHLLQAPQTSAFLDGLGTVLK